MSSVRWYWLVPAHHWVRLSCRLNESFSWSYGEFWGSGGPFEAVPDWHKWAWSLHPCVDQSLDTDTLGRGRAFEKGSPSSVQAVFKTRLTIEAICPQPTSSLDKFFFPGWRTGQYIIAPIMFNDKSQYVGLTKFIRSPWGQYTYGETVTLKNSSFSTLYLFVPCQEFQSVLFKTFALVH